MGSQKRGRGRPRREYNIRVRGERRVTPDYERLARALLEHAAIEQAARNAADRARPGDPSIQSPDPIEDQVEGIAS